MKRSFAVLAVLLPLLCGCGIREESTDMLSETIVPSAAASQSAVDKPAEKLSERRMEEFIFEGGGYEITDGVHTNYYGEITDEAIRQQLWDIICTQEEQDIFEGGSSGSSYNLVLTDRETGEKTYAGYTIWYANPEVEGGPSCFCVSGASGGTTYYVEAEDMQTQTYLRDTFDALVLEGIRREENITSQDSRPTNGVSRSAIVLVERYRNWAWGYQDYGSFVDLDGNVYAFDFSDNPDAEAGRLSDTEAGQLLYALYEDGESTPVRSVDAESVYACWTMGMEVNAAAPMFEEAGGDDMGQRTLYLFDSETCNLIPLRSMGDCNRELQDESAKKIVSMYDKLFK